VGVEEAILGLWIELEQGRHELIDEVESLGRSFRLTYVTRGGAGEFAKKQTRPYIQWLSKRITD
jgi:hypothetical protein